MENKYQITEENQLAKTHANLLKKLLKSHSELTISEIFNIAKLLHLPPQELFDVIVEWNEKETSGNIIV